MPNWCYNRHVFFVDNNKDKGELLRLHNNLSEVLQTPSEVENGFEPGWLGKVAIKHGLDWESFSCRGDIEELEEYEPECSHFSMGSETAWGPTNELWEAVIEQYEGVSFVYIAEEPNMGIFINTDVDGTYLSERYLLEIYSEKPIPDEWYPGQEKPGHLAIYEYFDDFEELAEFCTELTGKIFNSIEESQDYFHGFFDEKSNAYANLYEDSAA